MFAIDVVFFKFFVLALFGLLIVLTSYYYCYYVILFGLIA